ncbi:hypothetical protein [Rhodoferax sp.]|uniref:hypothetical protein n=1 Tax=Rhodoferax sp. TaxID=50421 RepID=UPI002847C543|nr:hypothetical protein [Rhodoferax sp.]MDR3367559.1 hypothetical protein [Rhodoferax sp.]
MNFNNKVILIAGASSSMGHVLALRLVKEGSHLIGAARRRERLESLANWTLHFDTPRPATKRL